METTMKTTVYAKKLRARMAELQKKQAANTKKFHRDVATWKLALAKWLRTEAPTLAEKITIGDVTGRGGYHRNQPFNAILEKAPQAPSQPDDRRIGQIRGFLRTLAITGQSTVRVSQSDVDKYFGDADEAE
jgi:hypothetical protein